MNELSEFIMIDILEYTDFYSLSNLYNTCTFYRKLIIQNCLCYDKYVTCAEFDMVGSREIQEILTFMNIISFDTIIRFEKDCIKLIANKCMSGTLSSVFIIDTSTIPFYRCSHVSEIILPRNSKLFFESPISIKRTITDNLIVSDYHNIINITHAQNYNNILYFVPHNISPLVRINVEILNKIVLFSRISCRPTTISYMANEKNKGIAFQLQDETISSSLASYTGNLCKYKKNNVHVIINTQLSFFILSQTKTVNLYLKKMYPFIIEILYTNGKLFHAISAK